MRRSRIAIKLYRLNAELLRPFDFTTPAKAEALCKEAKADWIGEKAMRLTAAGEASFFRHLKLHDRSSRPDEALTIAALDGSVTAAARIQGWCPTVRAF